MIPPTFVTGVGVCGDDDLPAPHVRLRVVGAAQPVAFVAVAAVNVARAGVVGVLGGIVAHAVDVAAEDRVRRIAEHGRIRRGALLLELGIASERIRDLHGLAAVGGVENVHRHRAADHVTVVAPHEHFLAVHVPAVLAIKGMKIPAGELRVHRLVREVIAAVAVLHDDLAMALEIVSAQEQPLPRGEKDVPVFQQAAPRDVRRLGEIRAVRPALRIVLREENLPAVETERLVVALRVDVRAGVRAAIPEVLRLRHVRDRGIESERTRQNKTARSGCRGPEPLASCE